MAVAGIGNVMLCDVSVYNVTSWYLHLA